MISLAIGFEKSLTVSKTFYTLLDKNLNSEIIPDLIFLDPLKFLRWANQRDTRVKTVAYDIKAFVEATDSSRPQFKNTPQFSSLARVDMTLLTMLSLVKLKSFALLNGISKSMVSPLCDTDKNPPFLILKSMSVISDAILASTY